MAKSVPAYQCLDGSLTTDRAVAADRDGTFMAAALLASYEPTDTVKQRVEKVRQGLLKSRAVWRGLFDEQDEIEPKRRRRRPATVLKLADAA